MRTLARMVAIVTVESVPVGLGVVGEYGGLFLVFVEARATKSSCGQVGVAIVG